MDNTRKQAMMARVFEAIAPIYNFLAINDDTKKLTMIDYAIETELKKNNNIPDDEFYNKIILVLQNLVLPNTYKLYMYKGMTVSELRDRIIDRLKKEMSGQDNKKKHWYEETEE